MLKMKKEADKQMVDNHRADKPSLVTKALKKIQPH